MLLQVKDIEKSFGREKALQHINLTLQEGQTIGILGKSGCGKTTLLKIIAGLILPDEGSIILNAKNISSMPARLRNIVYLGQEALLFPHLNVFDNIAFGLSIRKLRAAVIKEKVEQLVNELGLAEHIQKMPEQLSGGQKQRVNFGRALIVQPPLLLLDEPFGNLDTQTRGDMQLLFKQISKKQGITSLFVTHDLKEVILMGDTIGLLQKGNLKTFPDTFSFISDSGTGVQQEIAFWKSLLP